MQIGKTSSRATAEPRMLMTESQTRAIYNID